MQKSDVVKAAEDITKVIMDGKQDDESVKTVLKDSQTHGGENLTPRTPWSHHAITFFPSSSPATSPTKLTLSLARVPPFLPPFLSPSLARSLPPCFPSWLAPYTPLSLCSTCRQGFRLCNSFQGASRGGIGA